MPTNNFYLYPVNKLESLLENWISRDESEEDPDFRQEWVAEGIEIYKAILRKNINDEQKSMYLYSLASLYLEFGRSEKMIGGNYKTAFHYLQDAAKLMPQKGDIFYHLAFLAEYLTVGKEKWESAAFYAKEALENGLSQEKVIKIWCLLGKAYLELGFTKKAEDCFAHSKKLDQKDEFALFRIKYSKKATDSSSFARLNSSGLIRNRRSQRDESIEKSRYGNCYVLETNRRGTTLYGNGGSMALTFMQAELLKNLFEYRNGLTKYEILNNTASLKDKEPESIKVDIRRLRLAIKKGLEVEEDALIQTVGERRNQKYRLNPEFETYIFD